MRQLLEAIRQLALAGIATGTCISLLLFQILLLNEFASHLALSDKVFGLFRLTYGITVFQGIFMLILIWSLERALEKRRRDAEDAGQTKCS